jgi:beta-mannosidase
LPGDLLWPAGKGWKHHHLGPGKMTKYVRQFGDKMQALDDYVAAGQAAQAHYLHRAIEHWRRQKYAKSGAMIWQWNDPWPCISWSVVDYYLRPKLSYEAVKLAFQPLLVCAEFEPKKYRPGDAFAARIHLVNDLPRAFADVEIEVSSGGELRTTLRGSVDADQVLDLGEVSFTLPPDIPPRLELIACAEGVEISRNRYNLRFHDPRSTGLISRRLFRRWWQFLSE